MQKLLLLSNSTMPGTPFFTWPRPWVAQFLGSQSRKLLFVPFAAVTFSFDEYEEKVRDTFAGLGHSLTGIDRPGDKKKAVQKAEGIVVGGGNTFALLSRMYEYELLEVIREKVMSGTPYIGWSAGANLACPTLMTTNDMPIVQPPSFRALDLLPFQINPHYHELKFENQGGETRIDRLNEFLELNPDKKVLGLPEGMLLRQENKKLDLLGTGTARLFQAKTSIREISQNSDLSFLLQ